MGCSENRSQNSSNNQSEDERARACIIRIIAMDDSLGSVRNRAPETISLSETIKQYVEALEKLDFQHCPTPFAKAFEKHRQAWLDMLLVTNNHPEIRGEMHELFSLIEEGPDSSRFVPLLKEIWDSWGEIEQVMKDSETQL